MEYELSWVHVRTSGPAYELTWAWWVRNDLEAGYYELTWVVGMR